MEQPPVAAASIDYVDRFRSDSDRLEQLADVDRLDHEGPAHSSSLRGKNRIGKRICDDGGNAWPQFFCEEQQLNPVELAEPHVGYEDFGMLAEQEPLGIRKGRRTKGTVAKLTKRLAEFVEIA
jgi:hypothetical protein